VQSPEYPKRSHTKNPLLVALEDPTKRCVTFDAIDDIEKTAKPRRDRTIAGDVYDCSVLSKELFKIRARAEEEAVSRAFRNSRSPKAAK
jgi:hypothetical protein